MKKEHPFSSKQNLSTLFFWGLILLLSACKKSDHPLPNPINGIDIFIAGNKEGYSYPFVMKNGEVNFIEFTNKPADKIEITDFKVANGKHYGSFNYNVYSDTYNKGFYAIDQQVYNLPPSLNTSLDKIFIQNKDVYIAGSNENGVNILKNGNLWRTRSAPIAFRNFVMDGNNDYISTFTTIDYFKNGEQISSAPLEGYAYVDDIFVKNNKVYRVGTNVINTGNGVKLNGFYYINHQLYPLPPTDLFQEGMKIHVDEQNNLYVLYAEFHPSETTNYRNIKYLKNG